MIIDTQLLALICGHFLGDFVLQTDGLAHRKCSSKRWMLCHSLLVSVITWLLLGNLSVWWLAGMLFCTHALTDTIKSILDRSDDQTAARKLTFLFIDQSLHMATILAIWYFYHKYSSTVFVNQWENLFGNGFREALVLFTGLAITVPAIGVVLKFQMADFSSLLNTNKPLGLSGLQGLPSGGKTIGMLERSLVFMFVLIGKPEGVGFVIAAKSVFRIGELTRKEDREQAEYIMIGTLRSFTYALAVSFLTRWFLDHI